MLYELLGDSTILSEAESTTIRENLLLLAIIFLTRGRDRLVSAFLFSISEAFVCSSLLLDCRRRFVVGPIPFGAGEEAGTIFNSI